MNIILSDSTSRQDLKAIQANDFDLAQKCKEEYENLQRKDKKLREAEKTKNQTKK